MVGIGWFAAIFVGALAGWLAEKYMHRDHSLITNIFLGVAGAVIINWLFISLFDSTLGGWIGQTFVGFIGACALIAIGKVLRDRNS